MLALAKARGDAIDAIEPHDYLFYSEQVRAQRFALDEEEMRPFLQLDKLRDGLFFVA
jgi:peptidyl-dipeptidase Dcp